jgi:hypothetical protein
MGYEVPAERPGRPTVVGAAVVCLFALAAVQLVSAIITVVAYGPMIDAAREYAAGTTDGDIIITSLQIGRFGGLAVAALFAVGYAVLALFVGRGKNPARIVAWVVLGIGLCCNAGSLVSTAVGGAFGGGGSGSADSVDAEELQRRMEAALPGWVNPVTYFLLAVSLVAALAAVILLALPAANEFFRKPAAIWEPPVPGAVYPAPPAAAPPVDVPPTAAPPADVPPPGVPAEPGAPAEPAAPVGLAKPADPDATAAPAATDATAPAAQPVELDKPADPSDPDRPGGFTPPGP